MAISSINFAKSSAGSFAHNDRTISPDYLIDNSKLNEVSCSAEQAQRKLQELYAKSKEGYENTFKQKFQTKLQNAHWEAVVNLNANHTLADVQQLAQKIEKETGFTAVQISVHRDEGHIKDGKKEKNYHAHINFFTLDQENGRQLYRRSISNSEREKIRKVHKIPDGEKIPKHLTAVMDREKLSKLQDMTADSLGMERGKKGSSAVRLDHKQYKAQAQAQEQVKELKQEHAKLLYNFRETQQQITALKLSAEEKKELHNLNSAINKIKGESAEKDEKIAQLAQHIETVRSLRATDQQKIEQLTKENVELKTTVEALKTEIKEQRKPEAVVKEQPKQDHEVDKFLTLQLKEPSHEPEITKERTDLKTLRDELAKERATVTPKAIIEASKVSSTFGKKIDEAKLEQNIATALNRRDQLQEKGFSLSEKLLEGKKKISDTLEAVKKRTKTTLEAFKSKIMGKSLPEQQKERTEALNEQKPPQGVKEALERLQRQEKEQQRKQGQELTR